MEHEAKLSIRRDRWKAAGAVLDVTNRLLEQYVPESTHSVPAGELRGRLWAPHRLSALSVRVASGYSPGSPIRRCRTTSRTTGLRKAGCCRDGEFAAGGKNRRPALASPEGAGAFRLPYFA